MSRPCQNCTTAEQCHVSAMFTHMPSVYCSGPLHPGGTPSGQRFGPSRRSKSTRMALPVKWTLVIFAPSLHEPRSPGELWMTARLMSNGTNLNEDTLENGPVTPFDGSVA